MNSDIFDRVNISVHFEKLKSPVGCDSTVCWKLLNTSGITLRQRTLSYREVEMWKNAKMMKNNKHKDSCVE